MKKIALVTCYDKHNYGSMLQAYATQMALDRLGIDNETIDISGVCHQIHRAKIIYFIQASCTSDILRYKVGMAKNVIKKRFQKSEYRRLSHIRHQKFQLFLESQFRLSKPYRTKTQLSQACKEQYQSVLVGSDQLWLPSNIAADYFTLNFVPKHVNKVSYGTSFGITSLTPRFEKKSQRFLGRMNHISVRESSGQSLIENLLGKTVPVVCDPTLLFTGEEWMTVQKKEAIEKDAYILCYFLGNNPLHRKFATRLKEATDMKVIAFVHLDEFVKLDEIYADETPYNVGPVEFLNYIRNASYVCTDSFHGSVFASLYHKDFFTFRRYAKTTRHSTNGRVEHLLDQLGLRERLMVGNEDVCQCVSLEIDYAEVDQRLEAMREYAYGYLREALGYEKT